MKKFFQKCRHIFKYRNFKFLFLSQTIGNLGLNVQLVAISWLAYSISNSEFILGFVVAMQYWPLLFLGLYAGHVIDKYSKYEFIKWMQIAQTIFPFIISVLVYFGYINIFIVFLSAAFLGVVRMFDSPLRSAMLSYVVPKEDIKDAYSLASTASQIARVVGPALGGFILAYFPVYISFLFTALGYLIVVILYRQMDKNLFHINYETKNDSSNFRDSLKYVYSHKMFREIAVIGLFLGIFFWSYVTYYPIIVKTVFGFGAKEFSWMISAYALGSIFGGIHSTHTEDISIFYLRKLAIVFGILSTIWIFIPDFYLMLFVTLIIGYFVSKLNIITNTLVRINSEPKYLGMTISLWMVITVGTNAIGSLYYGYVSEHFGIYVAMTAPAFCFLIYSIFYLKKFNL